MMKKQAFESAQDFGRLAGVLTAVTLVSALLVFHVWNQYRITQLGYDISQVTSEHRQMMEENKKLSIEVAVQGRTERMTEVARERFGLQPFEPRQVRPVTVDHLSNSLDSTRHASLTF